MKTTLTINASERLSVLQENFNSLFPYLKLEFFKHKHGVHKDNSKRDMINSDQLLRKVRKFQNEGAIIIKEDMSVADLEQLFQNVFGISAQVFRKSGRSWIETSVTDDWTLKRQNEEGKELSVFSK